MKRLPLVLLVVLLLGFDSQAAPKTLDIYFVDVEGGAATLIVTPLGESVLIDSGFPEQRDAERIVHIAKNVAGLSQIDHYITTHWHRDHVGGITLLVKLFPVKNFYDHGIPQVLSNDIEPRLMDTYRVVTE